MTPTSSKQYLDVGLALVPLYPQSKKPVGNEWQHRPITTLEGLGLLEGKNIGLHHAASHTVAFDIDHELAGKALAHIGINLAELLSKPGAKIVTPTALKPIYRLPEGFEPATHQLKFVNPQDRAENITVFELRAKGQDVLPPSVHPNGTPYTWQEEPQSGEDIPELPEQLKLLYQHWGELEPMMQEVSPWYEPPKLKTQNIHQTKGHDIIAQFNAAASLEAMLERNGYRRDGQKYVSPSSKTGLAGVVIFRDGDTPCCYSHHASDVLNDGHAHDAFDVLRLLECEGDIKQALDKAREHLGMPAFSASKREAKQILSSSEEAKQKEHSGEASQIVVNRHVSEVVNDVVTELKGLKVNGHPAIYQRGEGLLVELSKDDYKLHERSKTDTLKAFLHDVLRPVTQSFKEGEEQYKPATFNTNHASLLLRRSGEFPSIKSVSDVPLVLPDGTILLEPGYYPEHGYFLNTAGIRINLMPVDTALKLFLDAFNEFSYQNPKAGFTVTLALILQPFLLPYIDDLTPIYAILGSRRAGSGTGKGYLIDLAYRVHKGKPYTHDGSMAATDEEMGKVLFSALSEGVSHIIFDDIEHLKHRSLMAAVTSRFFKGRILGVSQRHEVSTGVTWVVTGNAPDIQRDFYRRMIPIHMGVGKARAWERQYSNPDIHREILENRNLYLSAAMSIIKHWLDIGQPLSKKTIRGFDRWSAVMGGILESLGLPHLLEARDGLDQLIEVDNSDLDLLIDFWAKSDLVGEAVRAKSLLSLARRANVFTELWDNKSEEAGAAAIAKYIKPFTNDVFGNHYLRRKFDSDAKTYKYHLEAVRERTQTLDAVFADAITRATENPRSTPVIHSPDDVTGVLRGSSPAVLIPNEFSDPDDDGDILIV
jgi:hypothetical protein